MATMQGNYVALLVQATCPMPLDAVWVPGAVVYLVSIPAESDDKVTQVDDAHLHHAAWVPMVVVYLVSIPAVGLILGLILRMLVRKIPKKFFFEKKIGRTECIF